MARLVAFGILSLPILIVSWRTLTNVRSHGFYRFFSWECILWLLVSNISFWFDHPFKIPQLISWTFLFISVYLVTTGAIQLKKGRKSDERNGEKTLYQFEKTSDI